MPPVSIIVPCYNEEATISLLLDAITRQSFPLQDMEVIISDGLSTDGTRAVIADYQRAHPKLSLHIVDNEKRKIPAGLNKALEAAQGTYIIRLDAHSIPAPDYVERCIRALESGKGQNVGGIWLIQPGGQGWIARSIALAAAHRLGVGDARYRIGGSAQAVETIPFGAFSLDLIDEIGPFNESLQTNEDYEFNVRIRNSGGTVWFDPQIQSTYIARPSLDDLAKQYWRYGYWKAQMLRRYPETIRWRQALPPLFIMSLITLSLLSFITFLASYLLIAEITLYISILFISGLISAIKHRDLPLFLGVPLSFATMHFSWGAAFIWGILHTHNHDETGH